MTRRPDYLWLAFCILFVATVLVLLVTQRIPGDSRMEGIPP